MVTRSNWDDWRKPVFYIYWTRTPEKEKKCMFSQAVRNFAESIFSILYWLSSNSSHLSRLLKGIRNIIFWLLLSFRTIRNNLYHWLLQYFGGFVIKMISQFWSEILKTKILVSSTWLVKIVELCCDNQKKRKLLFLFTLKMDT